MAYGAAMVAMGWPEIDTTGLGDVHIVWPPCAHMTVAPMVKMDPGIFSALVRGLLYEPAMVNAVSLIATVLPMRLMVACPLLM